MTKSELFYAKLALQHSHNYHCISAYNKNNNLLQQKYMKSVSLPQAYHYGLTTSNHVWILPGIYRSHWWQLTEGDTSDCTDKVILEAINSTLFIDTLPFDISLAEVRAIL